MEKNNSALKPGAQMALELVSDKWTIQIIHCLKGGTKRYNELRRSIPGVSERMLTHTLRRMESDGLIVRTVYPVVPPHTEYTLTPLGETLWFPLHELCLWAEKHFPQIQEQRQKYAETATGKRSTELPDQEPRREPASQEATRGR